VALYAGTDRGRRERARAHAAYSAGRLAVYVLAGACAGALGGVVDRAGAWAGWTRAAAVASGTLIAAWGIVSLTAALGLRAGPSAPGAWRRTAAAATRWALGHRPGARALLLGAGSALLPCGWLYAFVATAGGTGSAAKGAFVMAVFWTGTLPAMLALGEAVRAVSGPLRRHVPALCAAVVVILGVLTIVGRSPVAPPGAAGAAPPPCHGTR
jgi:sulfite exporter TauE/SafE